MLVFIMKQIKKTIRYPWWTLPYRLPAYAIYSVVALLFFVRSVGTIDPDFGWHLAAGQQYWQHGIPSHDIFTFSAAAFPWINHEWLSDMVLAAVYGTGGHLLLAVVYAALWAGAFWLVARRAKLPLLVLAGVLVALPFAGIRAVTWTIVMAALLHELLRHSWRVRWLIPLLMALWANLHGGFVIGLVYLGCRWLRQPSWRLMAIGLVSALATTLTPYGAAIYVEVVRTVGDRSLHGRIEEWRSLAFGLEVVLFAAVWAALRYVRSRSVWRVVFSFEMLLVLAAVSSIRNVPLLALFVTADIAQMATEITAPWPMVWHRLKLIWPAIATLTAVMVLFTLWLAYQGLSTVRFNPEAEYPVAIAQSLRQGVCRDSNLFNDYNIGGYLIWRAPEQKVYIDGRMPSWQYAGKKYMDEYYQVLSDASVRDRVFTELSIGCVAIKADSNFTADLKKQGWQVKIDNSAGYSLLKR